MTAKRFTIKPSMIVDDVTVIIDNQKEYTFPVLDSTLNYMFCKALNEQHETIERLKQNITELLSVDIEEELLKENKQLKQRINVLDDQITAQGIVIEGYQNRNQKLLDEKEQLKKELFETRKDYILETYSDNPIRRDEKLKALKKELKE